MRPSLDILKLTRKLLLALMITALFAPIEVYASRSETLCITLDLQASYDSNLGARIEREGIELATVNGRSISFYTAPYTELRDSNGRTVRSTATGCFSKKILETSNVIAISTTWGIKSDGEILGSATARFALSTKPERGICTETYVENTQRERTCKANITIPLTEIDPELAARVAAIDAELKSARRDLDVLQREVVELEVILRDRMNGPFESLDLSSFGGIPMLHDVHTLWLEARKSIDEMKKEASSLLKRAEEVEGHLRKNLEYIEPQLVLPEVPAPSLPDIPRSSEAADYRAWGANWIRKLDATRTNVEVQAVAAQFLRSATALRKSLQASVYILDELRSFLETVQAVERVLYETGCGGRGCIGRDGYAPNSPVPQKIRKIVKDDLPSIDAAAAARLERNVRSWEGALTPEQKKVLEVVDALGVAARHVGSIAHQDLTAARRTLGSVMDGAVGFLTATCSAGASLTPGLNDFVDFYEAVSGQGVCDGKTLQPWEQVLTGAGLFAGSGLFWRELGRSLPSVGKAWDKVVLKFTTKKLSRTTLRTIRRALEGTRYPPVRILEAGDKVAIIGRSMGNGTNLVGVRDAAAALKKASLETETFAFSPAASDDFVKVVKEYRDRVGNQSAMLPLDDVRTTAGYAENKAWAEKLKSEGFTVLDLGNPNGLAERSAFYEIELSVLFGEGI